MEIRIFIGNKEKSRQLIEEEFETQINEIKAANKSQEDDDLDALSRKVLRDLQGEEDDEQDSLKGGFITFNEDEISDKSAYLTSLFIPLENILSIYKDEENKIQEKEVMVVTANGGVFDALFEEDKYEMYKEYTRMKDFITVNTMKLTYDALMQEFKRGVMMMNASKEQVSSEANSEKPENIIIPMANMDKNKN